MNSTPELGGKRFHGATNQCRTSDNVNVMPSAMRIRRVSQKRAGPESFWGRPPGLVAWGAVGASRAAPRVGSPWSG